MLYSYMERRYLLVLGSDMMEDSERVGWPVLFYGDVWPPTKTNTLRKDGDDTRQQYYVLEQSHLVFCHPVMGCKLGRTGYRFAVQCKRDRLRGLRRSEQLSSIVSIALAVLCWLFL